MILEIAYVSYPAGNYMFKVNNRNTKFNVRYVQSQQYRHQNDVRRRSDVFIVNLEHIFHLVFLLLTLSR